MRTKNQTGAGNMDKKISINPYAGRAETSMEPEAVCPWCGEENPDFHELEKSEGYVNCDWCGKGFAYSRDMEVTYNTYRHLTEEEIPEAVRMMENDNIVSKDRMESFVKNYKNYKPETEKER